MEETKSEGDAQNVGTQAQPPIPPVSPPQQPFVQPGMQPNAPKEPFYKKTWFVVLLMICFPPVGILLAWVLKKPSNKTARIVLTVVSALMLVYFVMAPKTTTTKPVATPSTQEQSQPSAEQKPSAENEKVDKSDLTNVIKAASALDVSIYTADSAAALTSALEGAKLVAADDAAKKSDVSSATKKLNEATLTLVVRVDPVILSGSGDDVIEIPAELSVCLVTAENNGSGNFAVWSLDANNENIDLLVNEIGMYSGTTTTGMRSKKASYLKVTSDGDWSITMSPVTEAPAVVNGAANAGDSVVRIEAGSAGKLTFTNDGDSNFTVYGIGKSGDLLVNEIGTYSGTVPNKGYTVLVVGSNGTWTVSW